MILNAAVLVAVTVTAAIGMAEPTRTAFDDIFTIDTATDVPGFSPPSAHFLVLVPATDDRVLLAANPAEGLLVVHPPAALDTMVVAVHADLLGGGQA
ncbi:hypothetical protein [Micromonospora sp. NPDC023644]|uniref:hypothetical protein n=1 Tax=Micromonospora sp. NPDC023644 TaxID=3154321 RepID=UPI0033BFF180